MSMAKAMAMLELGLPSINIEGVKLDSEKSKDKKSSHTYIRNTFVDFKTIEPSRTMSM